MITTEKQPYTKSNRGIAYYQSADLRVDARAWSRPDIDEEPSGAGVSWHSIGTVPPAEAREFARQIIAAADWADAELTKLLAEVAS